MVSQQNGSFITRDPWPSPDDPIGPNTEEREVMVTIENDIKVTAPDLYEELLKMPDKWATLCCFTRGYYYNQFKKEKDPERLILTIRILKRALLWRNENSVSLLADRTLPRRDEFSACWVSGISGFTNEGRPVYIMHTLSPNLTKEFTKKEAAWLHWQEKEWVLREQAIQAQKRNRLVLSQVTIVDFGNDRVTGHGMSMDTVKWFKSALKWEPADMEPGEEAMDVDGYCYPDSLHKCYLMNSSWMIKSLWAVAKIFVYPTTREKFRVMGSDEARNVETFVKDGIPRESLPAYIGGNGLNPAGLVIKESVKKGKGASCKMIIPPEHSIMYKFKSKKGVSSVSVTITVKDDEKHNTDNQLTPGSDFEEFTVGPFAHESVLDMEIISDSSDTVSYEITCKQLKVSTPKSAPTDGTDLPTLVDRLSTGNMLEDDESDNNEICAALKSSPAAWLTKRGGFRGSVQSLDIAPCDAMKGYLEKYGNWYTGFQKRFFVTNNEYLNYFQDEKCEKLLGSFCLKSITDVTLDGITLEITFTVNTKHKDKPELHHRQLKAESVDEANKWLTNLQQRRQFFRPFATTADAENKEREMTERSAEKAPKQSPKLSHSNSGSGSGSGSGSNSGSGSKSEVAEKGKFTRKTGNSPSERVVVHDSEHKGSQTKTIMITTVICLLIGVLLGWMLGRGGISV